MIENISSWANQIIIAVVIATIIELITPNGNNKKYIKMVIGMYILFIIISPIVSKITGESLSVSNYDYEKYFNSNDSDKNYTLSEKLEENNNKIIEETYVDNLKRDIKRKIEDKGYMVKNVNVKIDTSESNYGKIISIDIYINQEEKKHNDNISDISINKIEIGNQTTEASNDNKLNNSEKNNIINFLNEEYGISKDKINVKGG